MSDEPSTATTTRRWLTALVDLGLVLGVVAWFYLPFLRPGLPALDFASAVMSSAVADDLPHSPLGTVIWNDRRMCGRPTVDFWSPYRLLDWPFRHLDPGVRLKARLFLFQLLAAGAMYGLVRASRLGRGAAVFAAVFYPMMPQHIARTAVLGHPTVVMFYALVPLVFWALFALRAWRLRGPLALGLVLAAALARDLERTLILVVLLGLVLAGDVLIAALGAARREEVPRRAALLLLFGLGFAAAIAIDAYQVMNERRISGERGGYRTGEQAQWIERWSNDEVLNFVDRRGWLRSQLASRGTALSPSSSHYLGLSLLGLVLLGVSCPGLIGGETRRFWLILALLPLSIWLSFGPRPLYLSFREGLAGAKAWSVALMALALALALLWRVLRRQHAAWRERPLAALSIFLAGLGFFVFTAPFPLLQRLVFFLKDLRNPDWFPVTIASFAVVYAAATVVAGLAQRYGGRRCWRVGSLAMALAVFADLLPYRAGLVDLPLTPARLAAAGGFYSGLARDPGDYRVLSGERYDSLVDLTYLWHRKRLAWDYQSFSAPRRTFLYMSTVHDLLVHGFAGPAAELAGIANVKWLIDDTEQAPNLAPSEAWTAQGNAWRLALYLNRYARAWVQIYPAAALAVGADKDAVILAGILARDGIILVHRDTPPEPASLGRYLHVYAGAAEAAQLPAGTTVLARDPLPDLGSHAFASPPELEWHRGTGSAEIRVHSDEPGLVLVSESFHPDWRAWLDGQPVEVQAAGYAFLGVFVPAGEHRLVLRFVRPLGYHLWGLVSVLSLVAASLAIAWSYRRRRRPDLPLWF